MTHKQRNAARARGGASGTNLSGKKLGLSDKPNSPVLQERVWA